MAYPQIASYNTGSTAANATSTTITPPAGTANGDLLLLFFTKDGSAAPTENSGGFSVLTGSVDSGSASYMTIFYKQLTGTQSSFTISHASEMTSWIIIRIPWAEIPQFSTVAKASSNVPNPGSLTHTFGAGKEVLWIAAAGWDYNRTVTVYPLTFTDNRYSAISGATGGSGTAIATLNSTTNPQDPGTFTISSADTWNAYTLAVVSKPVNTITIANISGLPAPATGEMRYAVIDETIEYTGTVSWSPGHIPFLNNTIYTATITIIPKPGYTLTGIPANFFIVPGATSYTNAADSGVITAPFPRTVSNPVITITNYTKTRISDEIGMTICSVTFQCDQTLSAWEARATIDSQTPAVGVGLLVGNYTGTVIGGQDVNFDVVYDELTSGDRDYTITVYCQVDGVWY